MAIPERGHIYFIYRPQVEEHTVEGWADVQRFSIILSPRDKHHYRLIVIGRTKLPDVDVGERYWVRGKGGRNGRGR